jgi:hypothetical protein
MEEIRAGIEEIKKLYGNEKIVRAHNEYLRVLELIQKILGEEGEGNLNLSEEERDELQSLKHELETDIYYVRIKRDAEYTNKVISEMRSSDGWTLQRDDNNVQTYFKQPENSPTYMIKAVGLYYHPCRV